MSDLEVYIRVADSKLVVNWLSQRLGCLQSIGVESDILVFRASPNGLRVTLTNNVGDSGFVGVFISGRCDFWKDDRSFAHDAFAALSVETRFDAGPKYAPAQYVAITEGGENIVTWDVC